jgi:SAM-dependent methyltransferase
VVITASLDAVLLDDEALHRSAVVANNAMNRERGLTGVNSYARDLGVNPLDALAGRSQGAWLDLCCGSGRALAEAARRGGGMTLIGVDLVDFFDPVALEQPGLTLITAAVDDWRPERKFDLITCVHGLHYVGDKLGVLARALRWLARDGLLVAHLDLASIRLTSGAPDAPLDEAVDAALPLARLLSAAGVCYDARRRILTCRGPRDLRLPYRYLGADDQAGPNFTGQPAVDSYYAPIPLPTPH